ncbi:vacuolar protein sorting-associated protein VTA1 homolog [Prorops nasuta]|uniref:vacuolar protein sorting-associated protein VTA1 homolog n=1 Tax=Prorops nasuta TaxID=863751 RepID=UPI0034CED15D
MIVPDLPEVPPPLKNIQPYLKIASTHDERDPVISYWCRLYALQTGLKLSTKTSEETNFLLKLMDWLEKTKKEMHENEAITNDVVAQAHLENWALKLFLYADKNDRASNFGKSTIQSFYTAGLLYDVLAVFGDLSEEALQNRKYAKWKAAYIHNCLKNGENPVPGPISENDDGTNFNEEADAGETSISSDTNKSADLPTVPARPSLDMKSESDQEFPSSANNTPYNPTPTPTSTGPNSLKLEDQREIYIEGGVKLSVEQIGKAQKMIKWAGSALNYDDVKTAVINLQKALHLLTTGEDTA